MGAAPREVWQWAHLSWLELRLSELLGPGGGDYRGQALVSGKHPQGASLETKRVPVAGSRVGQLEVWALVSDKPRLLLWASPLPGCVLSGEHLNLSEPHFLNCTMGPIQVHLTHAKLPVQCQAPHLFLF